MKIEYKVNIEVKTEQFLELLQSSTLGARRPIDDLGCIQGMLKNSNLMVTAWVDDKLVGIARSLTDFHYACYMSDIAVDKTHQKLGIGKEMIKITQDKLGPKCKLILVIYPLK